MLGIFCCSAGCAFGSHLSGSLPLPFLFCTRAHSVEARGAGFSVSSAAAASSSLATSTQCAVQRGRLKTQRNKEINKTGNSTTEREKKKNKKHKNTKKT